MEAIRFIVNFFLQVLLVTVFLLRVLLPLVRADSRNQLSQAVLRITNPLVLPLRKVIPPAGKLDLASVVALLLVQAATIAILWMLAGYMAWSPGAFIIVLFKTLLLHILQFYTYALIIYALLSWIAPGAYSPGGAVLASLCEPLLAPVRRTIPPIGGIDLSVIFVIVGLQALRIAIS